MNRLTILNQAVLRSSDEDKSLDVSNAAPVNQNRVFKRPGAFKEGPSWQRAC